MGEWNRPIMLGFTQGSAGTMTGRGTNSFLLPLRPRRCDHFRFRISGTGDMKLYSLARLYESGSDVGNEV